MEITANTIDDKLIVNVDGRLTADCAALFKNKLTDYAKTNSKTILDLTKMEYIDSTGLGAIVFILQKLADQNGSLKLAALQAKPKVVFDITKAYKIFNIFDTVENAIANENE